ncbi:MAG: hypothetical protein A2413_17865 [Treponema sp. RIFOXYC1_FULL_61_9]|nr:MAG: hypothetical protein A2413_17865 [Treponema sp. RIFOXYC1_FULL_61_9]
MSAGYVRFAFRAVVPESYLPALASAFPVTVPAGAAVAVAADLAVAVDLAVAPVPSDPDLAFLVLGRRLRGRLDAAVLEENAEDYPGGEGGDAGGDTGENTGGPVRLVPFHAAFRLLPEDDRRRLAQNFLVREVAADELAELFYFRKTISGEGGSKRAVVRPQAFDLNEFAACLPRTVAETFVASVREGASSATSEDFIRMNERIYKDLAGDLRSGSLALSLRSERLLAEIHLRYVYPRARKRLDGLIEQDQPLAFLRALPPRIFRSLVDRSDAASLAPAFVGREASIEEIARWCSKRKLTYIREEARRLALRLSRGEEYPDVLCGRRDALAALAREITEREQLERGAAEPRRTAEDGGQATRSLRSASAAPLKRGR